MMTDITADPAAQMSDDSEEAGALANGHASATSDPCESDRPEVLLGPDSDVQPVLSVVMPTLNEEQGVAACIDRVVAALEALGILGKVVVSDSSGASRRRLWIPERGNDSPRSRNRSPANDCDWLACYAAVTRLRRRRRRWRFDSLTTDARRLVESTELSQDGMPLSGGTTRVRERCRRVPTCSLETSTGNPSWSQTVRGWTA